MKRTLTVIIFLTVLAAVLRLWRLDSVPPGLYQDETAIGYNAYSILTTGKDEHGVSYPLYFKSFGDWKLPVYIYLTVPSVKLFGLTPIAVRLPSAIFGILSVPLMYFLVRKVTENESLGLLSTALLTINPWHIHYSRATYEVTIAFFFFLAGTLSLSYWLSQRKPGTFVLSVLCFFVAMYAYNLTRILSPILFVISFLSFHAHPYKKRLSKEGWVGALLIILLLIPFGATYFSDGGVSSAAGTLITTSPTIGAKLLEFRSYMVSLPTIVHKLLFNMPLLTAWEYIEHLASYASVPFFFTTGSDHGNHGIGTAGQFYVFELITIVIGLYALIKNRTRWGWFFMLWAGATIAVAAATREAPHATRSFFLLLPATVFSARGILKLYEKTRQLQKKRYLVLGGILVAVAGYNILHYMFSYHYRFPVAYAAQWRYADAGVAAFLKAEEHKYDKIIIDAGSGFIYTSLLFYNGISPDAFHQKAVFPPDDSEGFSMLTSFEKYYFGPVDWALDMQSPRRLIITKPESVPEGTPVMATFALPRRPVAFAVGGDIVSYPVEETIYVAVQSQGQ